MSIKRSLILTILYLVFSQFSIAQGLWPRDIVTEKGNVITLFQPQPESLKGNILVTRTVVSVKVKSASEPVFGVFWSDATLNTDMDTRMASLEKLKVTNLKFPDGIEQKHLDTLTAILERNISEWNLIMSIDEIVATLEDDQTVKSDNLSTKAPEILYTDKPTTLILIDGEPIIKMDDAIKMEKVINTPFLIVKNNSDKKYYLYAGKFWYVSSSVQKGWSQAKSLPSAIKSLNKEIEKKAKASKESAPANDSIAEKPTAIMVSTKPAELIQTDGEAKFASVEGTGLVYASNSPDNIFKVIDDQLFYIVISGRWYKSKTLQGPWTYVESDKLHPDFAKIPEGSEMDVVLASVAGTPEAREAVQEAQIPQTAKVDRKTTKCTVTYDGNPKFNAIEGTGMELAENSSLTVLKSGSKYYAVDNGVWFVSGKATGPWEVSPERPQDVENIPPESPAYNTKYVYVYDVTPNYIYMGYTPGYLGCYVYGPTVVYGTGYYYPPWYGTVYYPYPVTYGFGMYYNPYMGFAMGVAFSAAFFSFGYHHGGYWGCSGYHPPCYHGGYYGGGYHGGGYHGGGGYYGGGGHGGNRPSNGGGYGGGNRPSTLPSGGNNIYGNRGGVSTRDVPRSPGTGYQPGNRNQASTRPSGSGVSGNKPATQPARGNASARPSAQASTRDLQPTSKGNGVQNNMYSDRSGNIYKNDQSGNWQQRSNNSWQNSNNASNRQQMDRSAQQRDRGTTRTNNAAYARPSSGYSGGSRGGGGGRGGGRR
jgi:hypothetical protein